MSPLTTSTPRSASIRATGLVGSRVSASALISARVHEFTSPVKVQVQGGDTLGVSFKDNGAEFDDVRLAGPAEFVFEGRVEI